MSLQTIVKNNPIPVTAGVLVLGFIGYRLIKKVTNKERIPVVPPIPSPSDTPSGKNKYTYGSQQYSDFAKSLYNAMDGAGTAEDKIAEVFGKLKTYEDVLALIDAYGVRKLSTPYGWDSDAMTLSEALEYEMDASEINMYVNTPLKKTGYKF